jgi:predicted short-subunit dehydrogenase-like oxidoreductase (DUF2520 family)
MEKISKEKIVLYGTGAMARNLGSALKKSGADLIQVMGRNPEKVKELAGKLGCSAGLNPASLDPNATILIFCVSDDAIYKVSGLFSDRPLLMIHTAGSVGIDSLDTAHERGVLYPLYTFSPYAEIDFSEIPLFVEASSDTALARTEQLAGMISRKVNRINSEQRFHLHIAAVFACNFSNHMYTIAKEILMRQQLSFDHLRPIIKETAQKVMEMDPAEAQTGPARRNDLGTLVRHIECLENDPEFQKIYSFVSESIALLTSRKPK